MNKNKKKWKKGMFIRSGYRKERKKERKKEIEI